MKKIIILTFILFISLKSTGQNYLGMTWLEVHKILASAKERYPNTYVELKDPIPNKEYFEIVQLVERNETERVLKVLVRTVFNSKGVCYAEMYPNQGSKINALNLAKKIINMNKFKLEYISSSENGMLDRYILSLQGSSYMVRNIDIRIGSSKEAPDIRLYISDTEIYEQ